MILFFCSGNKTEFRSAARLNIVDLPHNVRKVLAEVSGLRALIVGQSEAEKHMGFVAAALRARRRGESEMKFISRLRAEKLKWCQ